MSKGISSSYEHPNELLYNKSDDKDKIFGNLKTYRNNLNYQSILIKGLNINLR